MVKDQFKVGKNLVSKIDGKWVVEVWEYDNGKKPMYSVFDTYKEKENAKFAAKRLNRANQHRKENLFAHRLEGA